MEPAAIPPGRKHLDTEEQADLIRLDLLIAQGRHQEAQDVAEELWATATDAHRDLFQAISNALTAVCAREQGQLRGALEIAARTRTMLAPYPDRVVGIETSALLGSMDRFVARGSGQILLLPKVGTPLTQAPESALTARAGSTSMA
jgi:hypothetical protein